jgi:hypothetical protein
MAMELYAPETLTVQACKEWALALESEWGAGASGTFQKGLDREEQLYFQDFGVQVPEGAPGVKTGSAPADADAAVDSITPYDVQIFVRPARAKKKYATQADVLTRFGHGLLFDWRRPVDLFALLSFDMVVRRVAIARVLYDDTVWAARDDTRHAGESDEDYADRQDDWDVRHRWQNPIVLERRSPRFTKWRRTERGQLLCVTETYQITIAEARATFAEDEAMQDRLRQITQGMEPHQSVEVQDIWVGAHRCILVRDMEVFPEGVREHGYPEIPYVIMPFRETSFEAPGDRYRGMLTNAGGLYEAESQLLSMHMAQLAWNAWRTWTGWVGDENKDVSSSRATSCTLTAAKATTSRCCRARPCRRTGPDGRHARHVPATQLGRGRARAGARTARAPPSRCGPSSRSANSSWSPARTPSPGRAGHAAPGHDHPGTLPAR